MAFVLRGTRVVYGRRRTMTVTVEMDFDDVEGIGVVLSDDGSGQDWWRDVWEPAVAAAVAAGIKPKDGE